MLANTNIADQPSTDSQRRLTQPKKIFSGLDTAELRIAPLTKWNIVLLQAPHLHAPLFELVYSAHHCGPCLFHVRWVTIFTARPEESLQAIAFSSWNYMEVQVRHALTHTIVDGHERALCCQCFFHRNCEEPSIGREL